MYCLHLQGRRLSHFFLLSLFFDHEDGKSYVLPKLQWVSTRIHSITSQKTVLFTKIQKFYLLGYEAI
jgi:hypothetical protein